MNSKKEVQHVYLVGAKSLGAYGGYETFVYKLTEYHQNKENIKYAKNRKFGLGLKERHGRYEEFRKEYLNRTPRTTKTNSEIFKKDYSACVVGSDVVWKPEIAEEEHSKIYFLQFAGDNTKKIAYAASIGTDDMVVLDPPLIEKPVNQKFSLHQMEHYQKFYENGEYVRAVESTTEQNYNMIDGCANNLPKPRIINGRESVLDKLRIRQMAREKQKSSQEQSADMERNRK